MDMLSHALENNEELDAYMIIRESKHDKHMLGHYLCISIMYNNISCIEMCVEFGAYLNHKYGYMSETPLHIAIKSVSKHKQHIVDLLLQAGAYKYCHYLNLEDYSPVAIALKKREFGILDSMLKYKIEIPNINSLHSRLLITAINRHDIPLLHKLMPYTIQDINTYVDGLGTPLIAAVSNNQAYIIAILISNGANIHLLEPNGDSLLFRAVQHKAKDSLDLLLELGLDINTQNEDKDTVTSYAILVNRYALYEYLLSRGGRVDLPNMEDLPFHEILFNIEHISSGGEI